MTGQKHMVAVTGATGFIGGRLMKALAGSHVVALAGDVRDKQTFDARFDVLVHLAGAMPAAFTADPIRARTVNVDGTAHAVDACRRNGARLILASTSGVYDRAGTGALTETAALGPASPYAESKLAAEKLAHSLDESCSLRIFNAFGRGQDEGMLVGYLTACAMAGQELHIRTPESRRDFIHVDDICTAIVACLRAPALPAILNIGSGRATRVGDLVHAILARTKHTIAVRWDIDGPADCVYADIAAARSALDWVPRTDLEDGLDEAMS